MKEGGSAGAAYLHTAFPLSSSCSYSRDSSRNLWCYRWIPLCWKVFAGGSGTSTWPAILRRVSWVQKPLRFAFSSEKLLPLWVFVERNRYTQIYMKKKIYINHCHSPKNSPSRTQLSKTLFLLLHSPHTSLFHSTLCVLSNCLVGQKFLLTHIALLVVFCHCKPSFQEIRGNTVNFIELKYICLMYVLSLFYS